MTDFAAGFAALAMSVPVLATTPQLRLVGGVYSCGVERGAGKLASGAFARIDPTSGVANAGSADEAADYDEGTGDADADAEGLKRGLTRCDGDRRRFAWWEAGDRRAPERQLLGLCDGCMPARGERLSGKFLIEGCAELGRHERADRDRRDQARYAGDRVVDGGSDSRLARVDAREDRGGERRDGDRQAQREQEYSGEYLGQVIDPDPEA